MFGPRPGLCPYMYFQVCLSDFRLKITCSSGHFCLKGSFVSIHVPVMGTRSSDPILFDSIWFDTWKVHSVWMVCLSGRIHFASFGSYELDWFKLWMLLKDIEFYSLRFPSSKLHPKSGVVQTRCHSVHPLYMISHNSRYTCCMCLVK